MSSKHPEDPKPLLLSTHASQAAQDFFAGQLNEETPSCNPVQLKERLLSGDDSVVNELIYCFHDDLLRFLRRRCGENSDAEDAMQDTYVAMLRYIEGFRGESSVKNWLYRIASTSCQRMRRGQKNNPHLHLSLQAEEAPELPEQIDQFSGELQADLRPLSKALSLLSEQDRAILLLRDLEGYSTLEAAEATGLTESAVKSRLHRARSFLREHLDDQFPEKP
ncbi:MAG: RNA polymerase sigma factor [Myxococcales bacterium]|nr:RNA polymerase sigma factor [Myxococcales bacterium]